MDETYAEFLVFSIFLVSLFSYLAVKSWANARRLEREAFYRSEAIKKLAEMQGAIPESVLQLVRDALAPVNEPSAAWSPTEYRAYQRSETLRRIMAMPGAGVEGALQFLREEDRNTERRMRAGIRLGGLIATASGFGLLVFLKAITEKPVYFVSLIPILVGLTLVVYSYLRSRETELNTRP